MRSFSLTSNNTKPDLSKFVRVWNQYSQFLWFFSFHKHDKPNKKKSPPDINAVLTMGHLKVLHASYNSDDDNNNTDDDNNSTDGAAIIIPCFLF